VGYIRRVNAEAKREFIYSRDLAHIALRLLKLDVIPERVLVSNNNQMTIRQVVETLVKITNFKGEVIWDTSKPNGQHARPTDLSRLQSLIGNYSYTDMEIALFESYQWFVRNQDKVRL
jgi:GDP-L-fucose synthase